MFSACIVMGIAPVIPKRKEQFEIEIKVTETENADKANGNINLYKPESY
jgi:hypothetical protein